MVRRLAWLPGGVSATPDGQTHAYKRPQRCPGPPDRSWMPGGRSRRPPMACSSTRSTSPARSNSQTRRTTSRVASGWRALSSRGICTRSPREPLTETFFGLLTWIAISPSLLHRSGSKPRPGVCIFTCLLMLNRWGRWEPPGPTCVVPWPPLPRISIIRPTWRSRPTRGRCCRGRVDRIWSPV